MPSVYCCVQGCTNTAKNSKLSFFTINVKKDEKRFKWLPLIRREDLLKKSISTLSRYTVCSVHFEPRMFLKKRLVPEAIPTLHLPRRQDCSHLPDEAEAGRGGGDGGADAAHVSCAMFGCNNTNQLQTMLLFHQFPFNAELRKSWIKACRNVDLENMSDGEISCMHICSVHFEREMYEDPRRLKTAAVPTVSTPLAFTPPLAAAEVIIKVEANYEEDLFHVKKKKEDKKEATASKQPVIQRKTVAAQTDPVIVKSDEKSTMSQPETKKMKLNENSSGNSTVVALERFFRGCDNFFAPELSKYIKSRVRIPD